MRNDTIRRIIGAYDDPVIRAYCWARFWILRQRFLDEIGQYLPASGAVLDIGCGFGLFSLYYAATSPGRFVRGLDVNLKRIGVARRAAARLGIDNVHYEQGDARPSRRCSPACAAACRPAAGSSSRTSTRGRRRSAGSRGRSIARWRRARRCGTGAPTS
jgi:SAM-dependent methyltransferase